MANFVYLRKTSTAFAPQDTANLASIKTSNEHLFQVGHAVKTNKDDNQPIDLGYLVSACITLPETCGPEGAAISFWFKMSSPCYGGIITSASFYGSGFILECGYNILE